MASLKRALNESTACVIWCRTRGGQQRDIDNAKHLLAEYKARKKAIASKAGNKHKG